MPRLTPIRRAADVPGDAEIAALFEALFPGRPDAEIDASHDGLALAAHSPALALQLAQISRLMALALPFAQRADLRELAILAVNRRLDSGYSLATRRGAAIAAGLSKAQIDGEDDTAFDDEQRLVLAYADAVAANTVDDALSARAVTAFGERGVAELTAIAAFWSFWALFLNATRGKN